MKEKIILGQIDLSFHKVAAGVFHRLLDYWGYEIEIITAPHQEMFALQQEGKIDLLISAWLPGSHGAYLAPYEENTIKFSTIYDPYCIWCVPAYIPETILSDVDDLNSFEVLSKMDKDINGIGMGAGISRFSVEMLSEYGLSENEYHFISNDFSKFTEIVEQKMEERKWFVIPLWHPQYLLKMYDLRTLNEPKKLLRGVDAATPILLKSSASKFQKHHLDILSKINLGNDLVTYMDYLFCKEQKTAYSIADTWLREKGLI